MGSSVGYRRKIRAAAYSQRIPKARNSLGNSLPIHSWNFFSEVKWDEKAFLAFLNDLCKVDFRRRTRREGRWRLINWKSDKGPSADWPTAG